MSFFLHSSGMALLKGNIPIIHEKEGTGQDGTWSYNNQGPMTDTWIDGTRRTIRRYGLIFNGHSSDIGKAKLKKYMEIGTGFGSGITNNPSQALLDFSMGEGIRLPFIVSKQKGTKYMFSNVVDNSNFIASGKGADANHKYSLYNSTGGFGEFFSSISIINIETNDGKNLFAIMNVFASDPISNVWTYACDIDEFQSVFGVKLPLIERDDEYGEESEPTPYGGNFNPSSDPIGPPELPSFGVTDTGMINVYNPTFNELNGFAAELFPDIEYPDFDTEGGIDAIAYNITSMARSVLTFAESFVNQNLVNYVIDCHIIPVAPQIKGKNAIKTGFKTFTNYKPNVCSSDYVQINCGSISIKEYYGNFLDYSGTKAKLFLPFVGFVEIAPEFFQNGELSVTYNYNIIDGSFMAFVLSSSSKSELTNTVIGQYGGSCCVHIPLTGVNYSSMISGVIQGAEKVTMRGQSGGERLDAINSLMSIRPSLESSNGYNGNSSFMGVRVPYLVIERPSASFSKNYPHEKGLPLNVTKKINSVTGFTIVDNLRVDSLSCSIEEKDLIKESFRKGVIV